MTYNINTLHKQINKEKLKPLSNSDRINMAFGSKASKKPAEPKQSYSKPKANPKPNQFQKSNTKASNIEVILPKREKRVDKMVETPIIEKIQAKINKKHPKFFSSETMSALESEKHLIIGSKNCGHCSQQKKLIDGQYVALDVNVIGEKDTHGNIIGMKIEPKNAWGNYKDTVITNKNTYQKLSNLDQQLSEKLPQIQQSLKQIQQQRQKLNKKDKDGLAKLNFQEQQYQGFIANYNMVHELREQSKHLYNTNALLIDPKIGYQKTIDSYKILYVDGEDKNERKIANEIADNYDLEGYPMQVLDTCEVNVKDKTQLAKCKVEGMKSPLQLVTFDAEQQGDLVRIEYVKEIQKKLRELE